MQTFFINITNTIFDHWKYTVKERTRGSGKEFRWPTNALHHVKAAKKKENLYSKICIVTPSMTVFILFSTLLSIPISTLQFLLFNAVLFLTWETFFHQLKIPVELVLKNIHRVCIKCNKNKEKCMKTQIFLDLSSAFESAAQNSFGITAGLWLVSSDSTECMWSSHKLLHPALLSPGAGCFSPASSHVYGLCW